MENAKGKESLRKKLGIFLRGISMGGADIIPGISGGTMALITGIYDRLVDALGGIGWRQIKALFGVIFFRDATRKQEARNTLREIDWNLFLYLGPGILLGVVLMSFLIRFLLQDYTAYTYAFFFGLIVVSLTIPWKMMRHGLGEYTLMAAFALAMFALAGIRSWTGAHMTFAQVGGPSEQEVKINSEGKFSLPRGKENLAGGSLRLKWKGQTFTFSLPVLSAQWNVVQSGKLKLHLREKAGRVQGVIENTGNHEPWVIFLSAALAICAMILPGISGAYILVLLGQYATIFSALHQMDLKVLGVFSAGMVFGLFSFVRSLKYLLHHYHSYTMAALTGIMIGSLRKLWPGEYMGDGASLAGVALATLTGAVVVLVLEWLGKRFASDN